MKILIIPDVHQDTNFVDTIFQKEKAFDKAIFLGDWFDSFHEPPRITSFEKTCQYLRHLVTKHPRKEDFVFLVGNHDMKYIFENKKSGAVSAHYGYEYYCSGVTKSKISTFRHQFYDEGLRDEFFRTHFKCIHKEEDWVFSHAGLNIKHFAYGQSKESLMESVNEAWRNFRDFQHPKNYLIKDVGAIRYGDADVGGVTWQDWNYEFFASLDLGKQIVGHTTVDKPEVKAKGTDYESWNFDCSQTHYGVLKDGKISKKKAF